MVSVARLAGFYGVLCLWLWFCICGGLWRVSVACGALAVVCGFASYRKKQSGLVILWLCFGALVLWLCGCGCGLCGFDTSRAVVSVAVVAVAGCGLWRAIPVPHGVYAEIGGRGEHPPTTFPLKAPISLFAPPLSP